VDNVLLIGKDGNAAEIGHMVIDFEGRLACNCGGRGHWEAYCSGAGIPKLAKYLVESRPANFHGTLTEDFVKRDELSPKPSSSWRGGIRGLLSSSRRLAGLMR